MMILLQRKKKPPDLILLLSNSCFGERFSAFLPLFVPYPESSSPLVLFSDLELYPCNGHTRCAGTLCLLSLSHLTLHGLHGARPFASANSRDWTGYLRAPALPVSSIGGSQQYNWVWLRIYRLKQGVEGAAPPDLVHALNSAMASCCGGKLSPDSSKRLDIFAQIYTVIREVRRGSPGDPDWKICSVRFASLYPPSLRPPKVCAPSPHYPYFSNGLY